jgi:serine protease
MIGKVRVNVCVGAVFAFASAFAAVATMATAASSAVAVGSATAASAATAAPARNPLPEYNPVRGRPLSFGPMARRLIVGFRIAAGGRVVKLASARLQARGVDSVQAATGPGDVADLAGRARLHMATSRQLTPSMHVLYLEKTLYGADVAAALDVLRADPSVKFAEVDQRRYPHAVPNDPLFMPSTEATGQWFMMTPSSAVVPPAGTAAAGDPAATDAVSAWGITTGNSGEIIADVDTGVRFEHPDLLRAGFGGRLLPGYDFVSEDQSPTSGAALGTSLIANDGDGWDPDPSDPGDWIDSTDQQHTTLFPSSDCQIADSSWHGTRVMGILGALTNNEVGVAGMTWNSYLLPVRALGKCGGYDSDIIAGMQWAAGLSVTGVPDNPFPATIINLSLGGSGSCPAAYAAAVAMLDTMGVLVVASAGNQSGPVAAPANCAGVLAVAGLRNVGTKVGYSSFGPEVGIAAPAGNCINAGGEGPCLRSIDTTTNTGLTGPASNTYTNQINPNLGTSFSAPIVRAVNANLTPAQLIARIKASATAFPQPAGLPVCPLVSADGSGECACPNDGSECGTGMLNAFAAVSAALRPIAAVRVPASTAVGSSVVLDATGSAASCGRTVASYAWAASGGATIQPGTATSPKVIVLPTGTPGSLSLTVTDSAGAIDTATIAVGADGSITPAAATPKSAGSSATACPAAASVVPVPPTVTESFAPARVGQNAASALTITLDNSNAFDLTQARLAVALPANLLVSTASTKVAAPTTSCSATGSSLAASAGTLTLSGATIPAGGRCTITVSVQSAMAGAYTSTVAVDALTTGPAGANSAAATATLTVAPPSSGGGGALDWWDMMFVVGVLLAGRRHGRRRPPP